MISVIIPTCNRNDLLSVCLERFKPGAQSAGIAKYEVIVSDDSNTGSAASIISSKYSWAKWLEGPKKGPAANRNNGAKHAVGKWLVFIDDDCIPETGIINTYLQGIERYKDIQVFEGFVNVDRVQQSFSEESPINTTGGYLWSCNFMISKTLFMDKLNGFDEGYPYASMEDVDLHYRLKKMKQPVQFLINARVMHPWRKQRNPFEAGRKRFSALIYFVNKFPEKREEYNVTYFLRAFANTGIGICKNAVRFKFRGFFTRILVTFMQLYFALRIYVRGYR